MDEVDKRVCQILWKNPRIPYREIADKLNISIQAVHRRIKILREAGVIHSFQANVSLGYLGAVPVNVTGRSSVESIEEIVNELRKNDSVAALLVASGNQLYVHGLLRDISELDAFAEFAAKTAKMPEPRVSIGKYLPATKAPDKTAGDDPRKLTPLDLRIIGAMHEDARMSTTDVADKLGVSAATVRRRLEKMIQEGSIEIATEVDPTPSGDVASYLHVTLKEGADRLKVGAKLVDNFDPNIVYFVPFSNLPNFLLIATWTKTMSELGRLTEQVRKDESVKSVVCNVALAGYRFETWRDRLLTANEDKRRGDDGRTSENK